MTPEGKVKKAWLDTCKEVKLHYINLIETGSDGDPDKLALPPGGAPAFVEFKRENGGRLSPEQIYKIKLYQSLGYRVFVIDNKTDARCLARGLATVKRFELPPEDKFLAYCRKEFG